MNMIDISWLHRKSVKCAKARFRFAEPLAPTADSCAFGARCPHFPLAVFVSDPHQNRAFDKGWIETGMLCKISASENIDAT